MLTGRALAVRWILELQISELQIFERHLFEFRITEKTLCRTKFRTNYFAYLAYSLVAWPHPIGPFFFSAKQPEFLNSKNDVVPVLLDGKNHRYLDFYGKNWLRVHYSVTRNVARNVSENVTTNVPKILNIVQYIDVFCL
jgi:hypothetical protein